MRAARIKHELELISKTLFRLLDIASSHYRDDGLIVFVLKRSEIQFVLNGFVQSQLLKVMVYLWTELSTRPRELDTCVLIFELWSSIDAKKLDWNMKLKHC